VTFPVRGLRILLFVSALSVLAACGSSAGERDVIFTSSRDGVQDLYVMRSDGSDVRRLTFTESEGPGKPGHRFTSFGTWSPDRRRVAFASNRVWDEVDDGRPRESDIFVMDADGANMRRLTSDPERATGPDFSPDGQSIAFVSERDGNPEIYIVGVDGSAPRRLTESAGAELFPDWHPAGNRMLFEARDLQGLRGLFVVTVDGSGLRHLAVGRRGRWSPDGETIAFGAARCEVGSADGELDLRPLPWDQVVDRCEREGAGPLGIYVLHVATGHLDRVFPPDRGYQEIRAPDGGAPSRVRGGLEPVWSPDGNRLLFHFGREGRDTEPYKDTCCRDMEIFSIGLDGSDLQALTWNLVFDGHMQWW